MLPLAAQSHSLLEVYDGGALCIRHWRSAQWSDLFVEMEAFMFRWPKPPWALPTNIAGNYGIAV